MRSGSSTDSDSDRVNYPLNADEMEENKDEALVISIEGPQLQEPASQENQSETSIRSQEEPASQENQSETSIRSLAQSQQEPASQEEPASTINIIEEV